jgi:hypothetical protein
MYLSPKQKYGNNLIATPQIVLKQNIKAEGRFKTTVYKAVMLHIHTVLF